MALQSDHVSPHLTPLGSVPWGWWTWGEALPFHQRARPLYLAQSPTSSPLMADVQLLSSPSLFHFSLRILYFSVSDSPLRRTSS